MPSGSPLLVIVAGGGPVGLVFVLNLVMMMSKKKVKIVVYEGRWIASSDGKVRWRSETEGNTRRDQVVSLQDHVVDQLPKYVQNGLFVNVNERVWPTSRNIPIREAEDRLLHLIEPFVQSGQVELIAEQLNEQSEHLAQGNFEILVGADGSNSFVRRYCNIQVVSEGIEHACGVAYNIPESVSPADEPLHQALNCVLTNAQTRYLVNASTSRCGYLNVRLIRSEYDELCECLQKLQRRNEPFSLAQYKECAQTSVWSIIRQGLDFFNIRQKFVHRVVPIEVNVRHAAVVVRELRFEPKKSPERPKTMVGCLIGDAAMSVHFWIGRGMNSGMKSAMALARNIVRSCANKSTPEFLDFLDYESFMARLRSCEQQGRSLRILNDPIDRCVQGAHRRSQRSHSHARYVADLNKNLQKARRSLEEHPHWPHRSRPVTDKELEAACSRLSPHAAAQLSLANPWTKSESKNVEILVEDTFPFDQDRYLPVQRAGKTATPQAPPPKRHHSHRRHQRRPLILWIVGDFLNKRALELLDSICHSQKFTHSSVFLVRPGLSLRLPSGHMLHIVKTLHDAQEWLRKTHMRERIQRGEYCLKIVTNWCVNDQQTAVDVVRAMRAESSHSPVLIIPNKCDDTRSACELPNVAVIDSEFELHEWLGIDLAEPCRAGHRVAHRQA